MLTELLVVLSQLVPVPVPALERSVLQSLESRQHPFSIALHITERPNEELTSYDLYNELLACNHLDALAQLDLEAEDLEAEAE